MTSIINKFEADNPDIRVVDNIVFWPGYGQLTAQLAANDAPDLVTMHGSVIADYQARGLLDPVGSDLASIGITPDQFTDAARRAVTLAGKIWGLPLDSWTMLWRSTERRVREGCFSKCRTRWSLYYKIKKKHEQTITKQKNK